MDDSTATLLLVVLTPLLLLLLFLIRQASIAEQFIKTHKAMIDTENELLAEQWRSTNPEEYFLEVERTFRPAGFLTPRLKASQRFSRDGGCSRLKWTSDTLF